MKKVIFISALAIAAAVSCTKSDIVDTKFNEAISFETYLGRDAQTKAVVATTANEFGIYGYYTGTEEWSGSDVANLWANTKVTNGVPATTKYWTNESDYYTFLAYAPYSGGNVEAPASVTGNPVITFEVPNDLTAQDDLIYSNGNVDKTRKDVVADGAAKGTPGTILMQFQHALSRITVRASETHPDYAYTITGLELAGAFVKEQDFDLKEGDWDGEPKATAGATDKYAFVLPTNGVVVPNDTEGTAATPVDCVTYENGTQYLMVIPVDLTNVVDGKETYANAATLTVKYKTTYGTGENAIVSNEIVKTVKVAQNFEKGTAYALNLVFGPNPDDVITFSMDVQPWGEETVVTPNPVNPEQGA